MIEISGNLWAYKSTGNYTVTVITTNGFVKTNGEAVMGRGCAYEASQLYPVLPTLLGSAILQHGNHCRVFVVETDPELELLVSLPVKHRWDQRADPTLILRSALELETMATRNGWKKVLMPRPGCGNGGLSWESQVRPLLSWLDDRFEVVSW